MPALPSTPTPTPARLPITTYPNPNPDSSTSSPINPDSPPDTCSNPDSSSHGYEGVSSDPEASDIRMTSFLVCQPIRAATPLGGSRIAQLPDSSADQLTDSHADQLTERSADQLADSSTDHHTMLREYVFSPLRVLSQSNTGANIV